MTTTTLDVATQRKWDKASRSFDLASFADDRRFAPFKRKLFAKMRGKTLMVAAGTGNDFKFFPPGREVTAIDISPKMLERAAPKAAAYDGTITLRSKSLADEKKRLGERMAVLELRVEREKELLIARFTAMEKIVSSLKSTGSFLTSQSNAQEKS